MLFLGIVQSHTQTLELVMDINQGPANGLSSYDDVAFLNDMMIFAATNDPNGKEVFILQDGAVSLLKDVKPGSTSSNPALFFNFKSEVYFRAQILAERQIWKTDGTQDGTTLAISFSGSTTDPPKAFVVARNDKFYFTRNRMLYVSDGTQAGTFEVSGISDFAIEEHSIYATLNADHFGDGIAFIADKDTVFQLFSAIDTNLTMLGQFNLSSSSFRVLGPFEVERGLVIAVRDANSTIGDLYLYDKQSGLIEKYSDSKILASRINRINDDQLLITTDGGGNYVTNGTQAGTYKITATSTTTINGRHLPYVRIGDSAIFHGDEQLHSDGTYATDGTVSGTRLVINTPGNGISNFISKGQYAFWMTGINYNDSSKVWAADINGNGATLLYENKILDKNNYVINPIGATSDKIYFAADIDDAVGKELYSLKHNLDISGVHDIAQSMDYRIIQDRGIASFKIMTDDDESMLEVNLYDMLGRLISSYNTFRDQWNQLPSIQGVYCITIHGKKGLGTSLIIQ